MKRIVEFNLVRMAETSKERAQSRRRKVRSGRDGVHCSCCWNSERKWL